MSLGLGTSLSKSGLVTPGIVTDSLVLKHNYAAGGVVPVSDGAVHLDGTGDYIDCGDDSSLNMAASAYSVSCWIYLNGLGEHEDFVSKGDSLGSPTADGWALSKSNANTIYFDIYNGSTRDEITSTAGILSANIWSHIVAVRPAGGASGRKIYLNGVDVTNTAPDTVVTANDSTINLKIGSSSQNRYLDGYICNVGIWTGVLTQPQIKSIMWKNYADLTSSDKDAGDTGSSNIVSWWNLDEGTGTTANDSHGSNDGSATFT